MQESVYMNISGEATLDISIHGTIWWLGLCPELPWSPICPFSRTTARCLWSKSHRHLQHLGSPV